ncbi:hypothetical protein HK097_007908 [Rhizophlyctis rosea]|uniref:Glucanase n=1 Tax=Rhizophlyctis rosea TaxID=64517 RepID=A0AAD5SD18_9FUNG|nr:hypothetical protein HK097_007908 [Rhizophlyctis rosea]
MRTTLAALSLTVSLFAGSAVANSAYGQCGGQGWNGDKTCPSGYSCVVSNPYYSQCLPGNNGGQQTTTTTTRPNTATCNPVTITSTINGPASTVTVDRTVTNTVTVTAGQTTTGRTTTTTTTTGRTSTTTTTQRTSTTTQRTTTTTTTTEPTGSPSGVTAYPPTGGSSVAGNPYAGMPRYVNTRYYQEVQDSIAASSDSTYKAKAAKVANYPSYVWLDRISAIDEVAGHLAAADAQSGGNPIISEFVIYDLPGRDCHAFASNGELAAGDISTYKTQYIDKVVEEFKKKPSHIRLVLVIEPDSLPNIATNLGTMQCNSQSETDYYAGVAYAIAKLSALPNTYLYVDAAHGGWLGWPDNQTKIVPIFQKVLQQAKAINSSATIRGWASNTANYSPFDAKGACPAKQKCPLLNGMYDYNPAIDEKSYITALNTKFSAAGLPTNWVHDSSRNGVAGIRTDWGSWCNIKNAGIGNRPSSEPAAGIDAFVWVKPPGESDGVSGPAGTPRLDNYCDPTTTYGQDSLSGAPQAGAWFDSQFQMLVKNASPSL